LFSVRRTHASRDVRDVARGTNVRNAVGNAAGPGAAHRAVCRQQAATAVRVGKGMEGGRRTCAGTNAGTASLPDEAVGSAPCAAAGIQLGGEFKQRSKTRNYMKTQHNTTHSQTYISPSPSHTHNYNIHTKKKYNFNERNEIINTLTHSSSRASTRKSPRTARPGTR